MKRLALLTATFAVAMPSGSAAASSECNTRKCHIRVADRKCDQHHPRWCVLHVIYRKHIAGWQRAWLLRVPGCESGWNPYARHYVSGASGLYQFLPSTWASTPYRHRSIWSARWQAFAAAWMLRAGRVREWVCG